LHLTVHAARVLLFSGVGCETLLLLMAAMQGSFQFSCSRRVEMRILILLFLLFFNVPEVFPAWHLYLMPVVGQGSSADRFKPDLPTGTSFAVYYYGKKKIGVVSADVSDADDKTLAARTDVTKIPDNLDQAVGSSLLGAVQKALESRELPGNWITASTTYRQVTKSTTGSVQYSQRYVGLTGGDPIPKGVTLDTTFGKLNASIQQDLLKAATSFTPPLDTSWVTSNTTMRDLLHTLGDEWTATQGGFSLGGIIIADISLWDKAVKIHR